MKIVGMISVFNEEDIIEEMINHSISQGLDLVVLDGGSTDSTYDICKKFSDNGELKFYQFKTKNWDLGLNLRMSYDLALLEKPDWIIHMDADEFFESGKDELNFKQAINKVDKEGYNLIQFNLFEFFVTDNDNNISNSITEKLPYYSFETDFVYRAWKFFPGIKIEPSGGHYPIFPDGLKYRIYPEKFVCRHYRFRNQKQAEKKMKERIERTKNIVDIKIGWHSHLRKIVDEKNTLIVEHTLLNRYNKNNEWNNEKKFSYFKKDHKKREELFSDDGILLKKHKSHNELLSIIRWQRNRIMELQDKLSNIK